MQLFAAPNSPYARTARIALREARLTGQVREVAAALRTDGNPILSAGPDPSPVGRVPTLVLEDGTAITEAPLVFDMPARIAGRPDMRRPGPERAAALSREGLASGVLEGIAAWVRERRRGGGASEALIAVEARRAERCPNRLERDAAAGDLRDAPAFGPVAAFRALDLMDAHGLVPDWGADRPALRDRHGRTRAGCSARGTRPAL